MLGTAALTLALTTAIAADLARHRRWHTIPLVPLIVEYVAIIATSAPGGVQLVWLVPIGLLVLVFATLRPGASIGERLTLLLGERRLVPLIIVTALIAGALSVPLSLTVRADPRSYDAPDSTSAILEPIEAMLAIRDIDPAIDLYRLEGDELFRTQRWRTAALDQYDGRRWAPAITIRPLGRTLGPQTGEAIDYDVAFLDDDLLLFPLPGRPITIDALIQTDLSRTVVRLDENRSPSQPVDVRSNVAPTVEGIVDDDIVHREVDEGVSGLTDVAEELAGDGTLVEQLATMEQRLRDNFVLDNDAPGSGLQQALIERFLRDTQRGSAEQFATAFVLLARALGVDARVATGFEVDEFGSESITLTSADVAVWPEVHLVGDGWVPYDPVPEEEETDTIPPPDNPSAQAPAAPQPPVNAPPEQDDDDTPPPPLEEEPPPSGLSELAIWTLAAAAGLAAVVVPLLAVALLILGLKRRRRRRRLSAAVPGDRVRGAWAIATDALVDAGQSIPRSSTDTEIALDGVRLVDEAQPQLERLALMASAATYGNPADPDALAAEASKCLGEIERSLIKARGRLRRLRWRLSLRSLRRRTRSPVMV
jgi:hypothetical protein